MTACRTHARAAPSNARRQAGEQYCLAPPPSERGSYGLWHQRQQQGFMLPAFQFGTASYSQTHRWTQSPVAGQARVSRASRTSSHWSAARPCSPCRSFAKSWPDGRTIGPGASGHRHRARQRGTAARLRNANHPHSQMPEISISPPTVPWRPTGLSQSATIRL